MKNYSLLEANFSDEEMALYWTLTSSDKQMLNAYRKASRLLIGIQIISIRISGKFIDSIQVVSPRVINYLSIQLGLQPALSIDVPSREATFLQQRKDVLNHLSFSRYDESYQNQLINILAPCAEKGALHEELLIHAKDWLMTHKITLPGSTTLTRLIKKICSDAHETQFHLFCEQLPLAIKENINGLLEVPPNEQHSFFYLLKEYPPSASINSLKRYIGRYQTLKTTKTDTVDLSHIDPRFVQYLYQLAKKYSAKDMKRFREEKRLALMLCFIVESRKRLLDTLVKLHEQYVMDLTRQCRRIHEKKHRSLRKRQKGAIDTMLKLSRYILALDEHAAVDKHMLLDVVSKDSLDASVSDLSAFKYLEEKGYGDIMIRRYPSLRKYFAEFITIPFQAKSKDAPLMQAIQLVRDLDNKVISHLPDNAPIQFIPKELRMSLKSQSGKLNRNAWELGLAVAMKDALRSGDLFLPESKQHVSFWDLMLNRKAWHETRETSYAELEQPFKEEISGVLKLSFHRAVGEAMSAFDEDEFAVIEQGKLKFTRDDKVHIPKAVSKLQKVIDSRMPMIRIEDLLMEVDNKTQFSKHFRPIQQHASRPEGFYRTLIATLISQATNLGIVSMSASVQGTTVDKMRHVLQYYIREETIKAASADIVKQHHEIPFSDIHGQGEMSSSDGQRFKVRADSLLASYYPRYYGYYDKGISVYTHVSDKYSVFSTKVISCNPREALYVLDGLLENNSILKIREHTTDTHGYTEIIFALCYLLGYRFMPRIRDLKDQQLYRVDRQTNYGIFSPILNKTVDLSIIEEQWEDMIHIATSLKEKTAPAHIIVQRLTNSSGPSDSLSKAFTNLGRIIKTQYILQYISDKSLRRKIQLQLNKGEYRHKLPRWIFFANQGEFTTGDYEEIMNKASSLSLVSNAMLYWNTSRISQIIEELREQGEVIEDSTLKHISLLPYKHVLPNGTYFIN